jgi:uncharacterized membrane protein
MRKFLFLACTILTSGSLLAMSPVGPGEGGDGGMGLMKKCMGWCPFGGRFCMIRILAVVLIIFVIILVVKLLRKKK